MQSNTTIVARHNLGFAKFTSKVCGQCGKVIPKLLYVQLAIALAQLRAGAYVLPTCLKSF